MTRQDMIEIIRGAYESAMRNTNVRFDVYRNSKTGDLYSFEDIAGGNSEPEAAWRGEDEYICGFDFQHWNPGDGDDLFRENLLSYCTEEERAEVFACDEYEECEISGDEIAKMFPERYEEYCEEVFGNEMSEFDAEQYLD